MKKNQCSRDENIDSSNVVDSFRFSNPSKIFGIFLELFFFFGWKDTCNILMH